MCVCVCVRHPVVRINKYVWWMVTIAGQLQPHGKGIVMEVSGSSKEKECLAFMINKMSKRISLPKQRLQSSARLPAKGTRPDGTFLLCRTVLETKMTRTCVNSWRKHPSLCFVKVIKITPWRIPLRVTPWTGLFFLAGRVTVRQSWTSSQHTSRQRFPSLHSRPCPFLFWQETGDDNTGTQTSRDCLRPAAMLSSCGGGLLFSLEGLVPKHTKKTTRSRTQHKHGHQATVTHADTPDTHFAYTPVPMPSLNSLSRAWHRLLCV